MQLKGSLPLRRVKFEVKAYRPAPYMRCYCSICPDRRRRGFAINLGATPRA